MRSVVCAAKFWIYWVFTFLSLSFFTFYGQMTVAISPNVQASPCTSLYLAFNGQAMLQREKCSCKSFQQMTCI